MTDHAPGSVRVSRDGVELPDVSATIRGTPDAVGMPLLSDIRAEARRIYCSSGEDYSIEVDDIATVLPATDKGGHWVKAWVWVPAKS